MASGSGSQQTNPFPIRSTHPTRRFSPYPPNPPPNGPKYPLGTGPMYTTATPTNTRCVQKDISYRLQDKVTTLVIVLDNVKTGLGGLPRIQSALEELKDCVNHTQIEEQNCREYEEIMSNLTDRAILLQPHVVKESPWSLPPSISNVARALEEQTSLVRERQDRKSTERLPMTQYEVEGVLERYQRIGVLLQLLQANISLGIWGAVGDQLMDTRLKDIYPVHDAYHNAAFSSSATKRTGCTRGTRMELLRTIQTWIHEENAAKIYWLNGMAGTGKTTIAYSVCEMLLEKYQLGGSFFCSRNSPDCRDVNRIVPTIAYQLGRYSNPYRKALCDVLRSDPDAAKRNIMTQFKQLISRPLAEMGEAMPTDVVVVIDALDECTDAHGTRDVLRMLLQYAGDLPIRFFVSSRPEPNIFESMTTHDGAVRSIIWLHDIEKSLVQADIQVYLTEALASARFSASEIDQLAAHAGCLFIFAATAVRYILPAGGSVNRVQRLQTILGLQPGHSNRSYQDIDELYATILSNALDEKIYEETELITRQQALWTVICAREPVTIVALGEILDIPSEEVVELTIQPLQSVLLVSDRTNVVSALHASFPDFLLDEKRAGQFYCNGLAHNSYLADRCFRIMTRSLRFNICGLESSYQLNREVLDLQLRVDQAISSGLFYSCRYWGDHLTSHPPTPPSLLFLESFLQNHLLFWMEVLSLKGVIGHGESVLSQALDWLPTQGECTELRGFTYDARNFLTSFAGNPTSLSTPHIYISTLPFTSEQSLVHRTYWLRTRGLIRAEGVGMETRGKSALASWAVGGLVTSLALSKDGKRVVSGSYNNGVSVWDISSRTRILGPLEGHTGPVWSVACSPDNTRIASGSSDSTVRIWHAQTGKLIIEPLLGHSQGVCSVAFSTDGTRLASGSYGGTVRIWHTETGVSFGYPLEGHQGGVRSIAFSPDGQHLASVSREPIIRVWDLAQSAMTQGRLEGHTSAVYSIAYSSDGRYLASGSVDRTVRVWNMSDSTLLAGPFHGHTDTVSCVCFSPNGTLVVSGSYEQTIRVWDAISGTMVAGPFEGHGSAINSVLFTKDGTRILSGSYDGTIRVWDTSHGKTGASKSWGHTGGILSVALSPDGTRATSGSADETICVWDTCSGALVAGPFTGHTDQVNSVAFSPDGARIVSGSGDCTLRTWDASTGDLLVGPIEAHTGSVRSVAFSPDGSRIASGSSDHTIRLWDSHTGESVAKPYRGHTQCVTSIAFSPDGARIVSGSEDDAVRMWANSGTALWTSETHTKDVNCVAFSPDGTRVVSGSYQSILVLDAGDGAVLHGPFTGHTDWVFSVAFSPDGTRVVSGSRDQTVRAWDVESGTTVAGPLKAHTGWVMFVAFFPDGARIISGSDDHTIRVWDLAATAQASPPDDWSLDDDGWLTDSCSQRLFWVPSDLRRGFGLLTPSSPMVINADCTTRIEQSTLLGDRWHECYNVSWAVS